MELLRQRMALAERDEDLGRVPGMPAIFFHSSRHMPTANAEDARSICGRCLKTRLTRDLSDATLRFDLALCVRRRHAGRLEG